MNGRSDESRFLLDGCTLTPLIVLVNEAVCKARSPRGGGSQGSVLREADIFHTTARGSSASADALQRLQLEIPEPPLPSEITDSLCIHL